MEILKGIHLEIKSGESVAIVGASGSGKSTLLGLLAGLDEASAGRVVIGDTDLGELDEDGRALFRGREIGFVFQSFQLLPALTALENVRFAIQCMSQRFNVWTPRSRYRAMEEQAAALLEMVELHQHHHQTMGRSYCLQDP